MLLIFITASERDGSGQCSDVSQAFKLGLTAHKVDVMWEHGNAPKPIVLFEI